MWEKRYIIAMILLSLVAFAYAKSKKDDTPNKHKYIFLFGISFIGIGSVLVLIVHGVVVLGECLLLKSANVSGKLILIGYSFVIVSILFYFDEKIAKFFLHRNKTERGGRN